MKLFLHPDCPVGEAERGRLSAAGVLSTRELAPCGTPDEVEAAARAGQIAWLRGVEAGGSPHPWTGLILLEAALACRARFVVDGLGPRATGVAQALGAEGAVLNTALWLAAGTLLSPGQAARVRRATARDLELRLNGERWLGRGERCLTWATTDGAPLPAGADVALAGRFEGRDPLAILEQLAQAWSEAASLARAVGPRLLTAPSPWGRPIVQGPMANVAEGTGLARAVLSGGGLPFAALGALEPRAAEEVLHAWRALTPGLWGAGLIGFDVQPHREAHLAALRALGEERPFRVIVAGANPALVHRMEAEGQRVWAHAPAAGLIEGWLQAGATGLVFEGHEAGGHVGALSSLSLWEEAVDVLSAQPRAPVEVVLAGGLSGPGAAAMAAGLAAPLASRGHRVFFQAGSAFLLTHEALELGQVTPEYLAACLAQRATTLVGSSVGLPLRCTPNAYTEQARAQEARALAQGLPLATRRAQVEAQNLGRTRLAAKGIERNPDYPHQPGAPRYRSVTPGRRREEAAWTIGQGAALQPGARRVAEVLEALTVAAATVLAGGAPRGRIRRVPRPALPPPRAPARRSEEPIAVVGVGLRLPGAVDWAAFGAAQWEGQDAVGGLDPARWSPEHYFRRDAPTRGPARTSSPWMAHLGDLGFDPAHFRIPPSVLPTLDRAQQLALQLAEAAVLDAGWQNPPFERQRAAVILGNSMGGEHAKHLAVRVRFREVLRALDAGDAEEEAVEAALDPLLPPVAAESMAGLLANVLAGRVASWLDWYGGAFTVDAACAASLAALSAAMDQLRSGKVDAVLAGGVDTDLAPESYVGFSRSQALSAEGSAPFSERADGFVMGEGGVLFALRRLSDALAGGEPVWAVLLGAGSASDGRSRGITAPRVEGQQLALRRAWEAAGLNPNTAGLIEAHGTGTPLGDRTELSALSAVFPSPVTVGSVKSMIGHLKSAAGAAGVARALLAVSTGFRPPTLHAGPLRPEASRFRLLRLPEAWPESPRRAGVSAFGFGGTNYHLVLAQAPAGAREPAALAALRAAAEPWRTTADLLPPKAWGATDASLLLLAFGARDRDSLVARILEDRPGEPAEVACCAARFVVAVPATDRGAVLASAAARIGAGEAPRHGTFDEGPPSPLFGVAPGQGGLKPNPTFALAALPAGVRSLAEQGLAPELLSASLQGDPVAVHQVIIGLGLAWGAALLAAGLTFEAWVGHSLGELTAASLAGALDAASARRLALARGTALLAAPPGGMLAVEADPGETPPPGLTLAVHNGPRQVVWAGPVEAVDRAAAHLEHLGRPLRRLAVSRAYHTAAVQPAIEPFRRALERTSWSTPSRPLYAAATAAPWTGPADLVRGLAERVRFADTVAAMAASTPRAVFVELGPGASLSPHLVRAGHRVVSLDPRPGDPTGPIEAAARLLALGHPSLVLALGGAWVRRAAAWPAPPAPRPGRSRAVAPRAVGADAARAVQDLRLAALADPSLVPMYEQARTALLHRLAAADAGSPLPEPPTSTPPARPAPPLAPVLPRAPVSSPTPTAEPAPQRSTSPTATGDPIRTLVLRAVSTATGYDPATLDRAADLGADLGIDSLRRMEILGALQREANLQARDEDYRRLAEASVDDLVAWVKERQAEAPRAAAPVRGPTLLVHRWRPADPPTLTPGTPAWAEGDAVLPTLEKMAQQAQHQGPPAALVYREPTAAALAAAGFARCWAAESGQPLAVIEARRGPPPGLPERGDWRFDEEASPPWSVERWELADPLAEGAAGRWVVTGATGGIVGPCLERLAPGSSFLLLVRRAPPATLLERLAGAGAEVAWAPLDSLESAIEEFRRQGPIDGVLHAAGALADAPAPRAFEGAALVWEAKGALAARLLAATASDALRWFVVFSSLVARLGNPGQSSYAASNRALEAWRHPRAARHLTLLWTAWAEVGMAAAPAVAARLAARGLRALRPADGAAAFLASLALDGVVSVWAEAPLDAQAPPGASAWARLGPRPAQWRAFAPDQADLRDHQVAGRPLVPAAVWVEALRGDGQGLTDFAIHHPTFVDRPRRALIESDRVLLDGTVVAVGRPDSRSAAPLPWSPPAAAGQPAPYGEAGLFHGPRWRVLAEVARSGAWTSAQLHPSDDAAAWDAVFQLAGLAADPGEVLLPVGARRLHRAGQGPVRRLLVGPDPEHPDLLAAQGWDEADRVVLVVRGLAMARAGQREAP